MIRVKYSNQEWKSYKNRKSAQFMMLNEIYASQGKIYPVEAVDVFGITTGGVIVEQPLKIKLGGTVDLCEVDIEQS
jgi:hypothetical protein